MVSHQIKPQSHQAHPTVHCLTGTNYSVCETACRRLLLKLERTRDSGIMGKIGKIMCSTVEHSVIANYVQIMHAIYSIIYYTAGTYTLKIILKLIQTILHRVQKRLLSTLSYKSRLKNDYITNLNIQVPVQKLEHPQHFWSQTSTLWFQ